MKTNELISRRDSLISDIKKDWERIYAFNQVEKSKSSYDVLALEKAVISNSIKLVRVKVAIQAANMGYSSIDDIKEDCIFPTVFTLQQLKEQKVKLIGLKQFSANGIITKKKIDTSVNEITIEIDKLSKAIKEFNDNTDFVFKETA